MAHGLECRSPFLDQELVDFAAGLPASWKIEGGRSKRILKDAVADWFPKGFINRPKMGFTVPVGKWFRGEMRSFVWDVLLSEKALSRGIIRRDAIERYVKEHTSGERDHQFQIWTLLMLELWFQRFID